MTVERGGAVMIRAMVASLAAAVSLLAPGCQRAEDSTTQPPPNPAPRADLGQPVAPRYPRTDDAGPGKDVSNVEKDLRKDLGGSPLIKPEAPATVPPPPANPAGAKAGAP
jgi:hypothetical protein